MLHIGPLTIATSVPSFTPELTYTRDCTIANIMLDPSNMYPESFHPVRMSRSRDFRRKAKAYSRTRRPTRYLLIDFGLSRYYDPANGSPLDAPLQGGDKSAPEHKDRNTRCNPFPTDVYYLGSLVRRYYIQVCPRLWPRDCPYFVYDRNIMGSSLCSLLSTTWSKTIPRGDPRWMRLFLAFSRSKLSLAHGSYAPA